MRSSRSAWQNPQRRSPRPVNTPPSEFHRLLETEPRRRRLSSVARHAHADHAQKQLETVLQLIKAKKDAIFPAEITIKAPPWAPAPDQSHELFGPLVAMMQEHVQSNEKVRKRLVELARKRKEAASLETMMTVRRLAYRWQLRACKASR